MSDTLVRLDTLKKDECFALMDGRVFKVTEKPAVFARFNEYELRGDQVLLSPSGYGLSRLEPGTMVLKLKLVRPDPL